MLRPRARSMSMIYTTTGDHDEVRGLCKCQRPWGWMTVACVLPEMMWESMTHVQAVKDKEVSFAVVSMTADSRLIMRDIEVFRDNLSHTHSHSCPNPSPPKRNGLDRKPLKRTLKVVMKMLKSSSSPWMALVRVVKDSVFFYGLAAGGLTMFQ